MSGITSPHRQYRAPDVAVGDRLVCAIAGEVEVETFTHAAIRWPISTDLKIIFCGDLVKALENEPIDVVMRIWEVSKGKVLEWRKLLGIRGYPQPARRVPKPPPLPRPPKALRTKRNAVNAVRRVPDTPPAVPMPRYVAPAVRIGDRLHCALAGDVVVAGFWQAAEWLWPMHRRGQRGRMSFIYCGDLLRALNDLHTDTVSALWDVKPVTIRHWRHELGIPASDAERQRGALPAPSCLPPRQPAEIGDTLTCALAGPCRVVALGPPPLAWPMRAGPSELEPIFCGALPAYVTTAPLLEVAHALHVTPATVRDWRAALTRPLPQRAAEGAHGLAWHTAIADPTQSSAAIATRFGVHVRMVSRARNALARSVAVPHTARYPGHATIHTLLTCWPLSARWIAHRCRMLVSELAAYRRRKASLPPPAYRALCALLALSAAEGANDADGPLPLPAGRYVLLASDTAGDVVEAYSLLSWDGDVGFCAELVTDAPAHANSEYRYLVFSAPGRFAPHVIVFPREGPSVDLLDEPEGDRSLAGYRGTFPVDADTFALVAGEWARVMADPSLASRAFADGRDAALLVQLQQVARYFLGHIRDEDLRDETLRNEACLHAELDDEFDDDDA